MRRFVIVIGLILVAISLIVYYIPMLRFSVTGQISGEPRVNGMPSGFWMYTLRQSDDPEQRIAAVNNLVELGPKTDGAVEAIRKTLGDPEPRVRAASATALSQMATADQVRDDLLNLLADADGPVRAAAATSLGQLRPTGQTVVDSLHKQAKGDGFVQAKVAAIMALGLYGDAAVDSVPMMIDALLLPDASTGSPHGAAVFALSLICQKRIPMLTAAFTRPESRVQSGILKALASIGPAAGIAVPDVLKLTTASDPMIHLEAAQTLWVIERKPDLALSLATELLKVKQPERGKHINTRTKAMYLLGELGAAGTPAIPQLIGVMKEDTECQCRMYAAMSLGKIGRTPEILEVLEATVKVEKDPDVCWAINESLKAIRAK